MLIKEATYAVVIWVRLMIVMCYIAAYLHIYKRRKETINKTKAPVLQSSDLLFEETERKLITKSREFPRNSE